MSSKAQKFYPYAIIFIIASLLFIPFLGSVHLFDWDEINFAESAREMIVTGDYNTVRIDFEPFWEKPPLFIWMQALSMKIFGINEFAARFPNAVCGIVTLMFLFGAGRKLYDERFGMLWALAYAGSVLPFFYFKSGIIDPWFNLFIFVGIWFSIMFLEVSAGEKNRRKRHLYVVGSAVAIGLGILAKGPVALLIWGVTAFVYAVYKRFRIPVRWYHIAEFVCMLLLTGGSWFLGQILTGNKQVVIDFINYQIVLFQTQDAGHGGFFMYHFVILLIGVFPVSLYSLAAYRKMANDSLIQKDFKTWMIFLLWVVLIIFSIVKTKIVHYSSLCYFPLTFLGAYVLYHYCYRNFHLKKRIHVSMILVAAIYTVLILLVTNISHFKDYIIENQLFDDPFALANLQADGEWTGFEPLIALAPLSVFFFAIYFYRKHNPRRYAASVLISSCLFVWLTMIIITKRVEAYSQRAAIEFFVSKQNENCHIITFGYKSYAQYFYGRTQQSMKDVGRYLYNEKETNLPVYVSAKNIHKERVLKEFPQLEVLYEKNGFVFLKKEPQ